MSDELRCCYCGKPNEELGPDDDLRPYGPGGQPTCYACATSTPERHEEATRQTAERILAIRATGEPVVIGDGLYGVQPLSAAVETLAAGDALEVIPPADVFDIKPTHCPQCGYGPMSAATSVLNGKDAEPSAGMITLCLACGCMMQLDENIQPLPLDDQDAFLRRLDAQTQGKILMARALIKYKRENDPTWPKGGRREP